MSTSRDGQGLETEHKHPISVALLTFFILVLNASWLATASSVQDKVGSESPLIAEPVPYCISSNISWGGGWESFIVDSHHERAYLSGSNGGLMFWNLSGPGVGGGGWGGSANPGTFALDPVGNLVLLATNLYGQLTEINATSSGVSGIVADLPGIPSGLAFDTSNDMAYVSYQNNHIVSVVDPATRSLVKSFPAGAGESELAYDPENGNLYMTNLAADNVTVIKGASDSVVGSIPVGGQPNSIVFDPLNGNLYVTNLGTANLSVINGETGTVLGAIPATGLDGSTMAVDPSTGYLYVGGESSILVVNVSSDRVIESIPLWGGRNQPAPVIGVSYYATSGDIYVAFGGADASVYAISPSGACLSGTAPSGNPWYVQSPWLAVFGVLIVGAAVVLIWQRRRGRRTGTVGYSLAPQQGDIGPPPPGHTWEVGTEPKGPKPPKSGK